MRKRLWLRDVFFIESKFNYFFGEYLFPLAVGDFPFSNDGEIAELTKSVA